MKKEGLVMLQTEPEPLQIDLKRMAVIVVDVQNAFVSRGGMFDLRGFDISHIAQVIEPIKKITSAARAKKVKIVYSNLPDIIRDKETHFSKHPGPWQTNRRHKGENLNLFRNNVLLSIAAGCDQELIAVIAV